jgi:uncharacterized protein YaiE (UPF0345 family)
MTGLASVGLVEIGSLKGGTTLELIMVGLKHSTCRRLKHRSDWAVSYSGESELGRTV